MTYRNSLLLLILFTSFSSFGQTITNGLIGYWPFNGNANDESTNSNNGKVVNASLTEDRNGQKNAAYYFDGDGDYIDCGNDSSLFTSTHSCIFWFKYSNTTDLQWIINDANSIDGEWGVAYVFHPTGKLQGAMGGGSNDAWISARTNQSYADNEWHMFAGTYNAKDNQFNIYVDGCFITGKTHERYGFQNGLDSLEHNDTNHWVFGLHSQYLSSTTNAGPRYYEGYLDDVHLYNRALDACEVLDIYAHSYVFDTITVNDTVIVNDTNYVTVYDTTNIKTYDTTYVSVYDTTFVTVYDTTFVDVYDTTFVQINDTTFIQIPVYDTIRVFDTTNILVTDTLRIKLINKNEACEIKVYPNPTDSKITVNSSTCDWTGYFLTVYNDVGQVVYKATLNPINEIDLGLLVSNGFYYIEIKSPSDTVVAKRVVILY